MNRSASPVVIGTIGAGYAAYLHGNGYEKVHGVPVRLKTVCDLNLALAEKVKFRYGYEQVESDYHKLLLDPEIDVIDIVLPPFLHTRVALDALKAGKHVVTANKDLIAVSGSELLETAKKHGCDFLYEAAVAGGIPIIRPLKQCLAGNHISEVMGIVNGTTNFILTPPAWPPPR